MVNQNPSRYDRRYSTQEPYTAAFRLSRKHGIYLHEATINEEERDDAKAQHKFLAIPKRPSSWFTATISVLTLIALFIYTGFAGNQWLAMEGAIEAAGRQADAAERAVRIAFDTFRLAKEAQADTKALLAAESRAWLTLVGASHVTSSDTTVVGEMTIQSTGKNTAVQVVSRVGIGLSTIPISLANLGSDAPTQHLGVIAPGSRRKVPLSAKTTKEQWDAVNAKKEHIIVSGFVFYTDRFGTHGRTPVCQYWSPNRGGFVDCPIPDLAPG